MGTIAQGLECRVPPLAQVVVVAVAMWLLAGGGALPAPNSPTGWFALACIAAGASVSFLGVREFHKSATTVDPRVPAKAQRLVVDGIYRYSRNPMYAGLLLLLLGWAIYLRHALALAMLPLFVVYMNRFQIRPEERAMLEKFGEAYRQYSSRVGRWL